MGIHYKVNSDGSYGGEVDIADRSTLPPGLVDVAPPSAVPAGDQAVWIGDRWIVSAIPPPATAGAPAVAPVVTRLSKLTFIERVEDAGVPWSAILALESASHDVAAWLDKFRLTTPDADGTAIDVADPRTVAGVQALCAALETAGTLAKGAGATTAAAILA
jgi:hypothetical protein